MNSTILIAAGLMGLLGSPHCLGMCGGIVTALSFSPAANTQASQRLRLVLGYNLGRILTYALLGLLAGLFGAGLFAAVGQSIWPRVVTGLLLIATGLYMAGWWLVPAQLERVGVPLWRILTPLRQRVLPVHTLPRALVAGLLWGLLPCGLVYSALLVALSQSAPLTSSLTMLAFGAGTLPTLVLAGSAAEQLRRLIQRRGVRQVAGSLLLLTGLWTLALPVYHSMAGGHQHHGGGAHAEHTGQGMPTTAVAAPSAMATPEHEHHHHHQ